jgi:hypothetical protein
MMVFHPILFAYLLNFFQVGDAVLIVGGVLLALDQQVDVTLNLKNVLR